MLLPLLLTIAQATGQTSALDLREADLLAQFRQLDQQTEGLLGIAAIDLTTRRSFAYHGDTQFAQASSIKIPILIEMFRAMSLNKFQLNDKVTLTPRDAVGGSGHLKDKLAKDSLNLTVKELITAMIETSDNTATNECIRMVGMENVNRTMDQLGFPRTRLQRVMLDSAAAQNDQENISTPNEMVRLADLIHQGHAVSPEASRQMVDIMRLVKAHFRKAMPAGTDIASKPGGIPGVKCETGVVYLKGRPFALSVMTAFVPENSDVVEKAAALVFRHFEALNQYNSYGHKVR